MICFLFLKENKNYKGNLMGVESVSILGYPSFLCVYSYNKHLKPYFELTFWSVFSVLEYYIFLTLWIYNQFDSLENMQLLFFCEKVEKV